MESKSGTHFVIVYFMCLLILKRQCHVDVQLLKLMDVWNGNVMHPMGKRVQQNYYDMEFIDLQWTAPWVIIHRKGAKKRERESEEAIERAGERERERERARVREPVWESCVILCLPCFIYSFFFWTTVHCGLWTKRSIAQKKLNCCLTVIVRRSWRPQIIEPSQIFMDASLNIVKLTENFSRSSKCFGSEERGNRRNRVVS